MIHSRAGTVLALATTALLMATPLAHGASAAPLKGCYLSVAPDRTEPIVLSAAGFTPNSAVEVRVGGAMETVTVANASGEVREAIDAPHQARGQRLISIDLIDRDAPANAVRLQTRVTALSVAVRPTTAPPDRRVRWIGRGFTGAGPVYAHYVRDDAERRSIRLARPHGACGRFSVRRRQFPFRPAVGSWMVQIDQQAQFATPPNSPFVQLPISVRRVPRSG